MYRHGPVEVFFGSAHFYGDTCQLDHLPRAWRDDVTAQHLAGGLADNQLHQHAFCATCEGLLHRLEAGGVDLNRLLLRRVLFGQAHSAHFWLCENGGWNQFVIHLRWVAFEYGFHKRHALADRDRGEIHSVGHVAHGKHRWHAGLTVVIHNNFTFATQLHANLFKAHVFGVGRAASGKHHLIKQALFAVGGFHPDLVAFFAHLKNVGATMYVDAALLHFFCNQPTRFIVKAAQDLRTAIKLRGFHTKAVHDAGKLRGDITATHNENALWQFL
mmetsp:Transcript_27231/g.49835  ORF Transcript_27231/g.49835 Transcript_27231/m.49835 type:complete len:272 (-) Transcript_27231:1299-2114(-)